LEQGDLDEEPVLDTSKLLLSVEGADEGSSQFQVDPETLAILEAAGQLSILNILFSFSFCHF